MPMRAWMYTVVSCILTAGCGGKGAPAIQTKPITQTSKSAVEPQRSQAKPAASTAEKPPPSSSPTNDEDWGVYARSPLGHKIKPSADSSALEVWDAKGVRLFSMSGMSRATFDFEGKLVFAWSDTAAALYELPSGNKVSERPTGAPGSAAFFPDGKRIIEIGDGIRIIDVPSLVTRMEKLGGHSEYSQTAHRAFVLADTARPNTGTVDLRLFVYDTDREKLIGSIPMNESFMNLPAFSISADGKKIGWALGGVSVWDSTTNKVIVLEKGDVPEHPRYYPSSPYFAPDGNSVCTEQEGSMRTISIHERKKGHVRHCIFANRGRAWIAEASTSDIESIIIDVPLTPGWSHQTGLRGLYYLVKVEDLSPDRSKLAFMEERDTKPPSDEEEIALTLADAHTGDIIWRKELGRRPRDTHQFDVSFTDDGKTLVLSTGDTGRSVTMDVATGAEIKSP
jgi:hypothetical protein